MITVAIIGLLAAVAVPSYTRYIQKSRRNDAKTSVLDMASREERFFTTNQVYTSTATNLGYPGAFPVGIPDPNAVTYNISVAISPTTSTSFTVTAAPVGPQTLDACGSYTVNETGVQGVTGGTLSATECWK
jgi:type IV pilus assembly protein PilE